jgi:hypothetical protein
MNKQINMGQINVNNHQAKCEARSFGNDLTSLNVGTRHCSLIYK